MIGVVVVTMEALIGEVRETPKMNDPWFSTIPSNAAKNNFARSWWLTCSFLVKNDASQKTTAAPTMRKVVSDRTSH